MKNTLLALFRLAYGAMYQAQVGHWNVRGNDFQEFHDLFGAEYDYWVKTVDAIAEHIRTYDILLPTNLIDVSTGLPKPESTDDPVLLVKQYLRYVSSIRTLTVQLDSNPSSGIADKDLAGELDRDMAKAQWKMKAILRSGV